jgi:hypothetical protein
LAKVGRGYWQVLFRLWLRTVLGIGHSEEDVLSRAGAELSEENT